MSHEVTDDAKHRVDSNGNNSLDAVDHDNDTRQDAQAHEVVDTSTNLNVDPDINVVVASLCAKGDTVKVALGQAETTSQVTHERNNTRTGNLGGDVDIENVHVEAELVRVEQLDGVLDLLQVQTRQTGDDGLQVGADVGLDVNLGMGQQADFGIDLGGGHKGNSVKPGLAVLVLGVVAADLGRGSSAEDSKFHADVDGGVDLEVRLGPATLDHVANALVSRREPLLARRTGASLGPGAVAHGLRALEAGAGLDLSFDIGALHDGDGLNSANGAGHGGQAGEDDRELHRGGCEKDRRRRRKEEDVKVSGSLQEAKRKLNE